MNLARRTLLICMSLALCPSCHEPVEDVSRLQASREAIYRAVVAANVLEGEAGITRLSHVCSLVVDGQLYPVVDLRQAVKRPLTVGGANNILILTPKLKLAQKLDYTTEEPLYCEGDTLFVYGDLDLGDVFGVGNRLRFRDGAATILADSIDVTEMPMLPSATRKVAPQ